MKTFPIPGGIFDGEKFAIRYSLDPLRGDFWCDGQGNIMVPDSFVGTPIFDMPDPIIDAVRARALEEVDRESAIGCFVRSVLFVAIDELNLHALKINSILDAMDAATSLADLKTRIAAIADYPPRTPAQARAAIKTKIDNGGAD
jgi:hypothetical protein